MVIGGLTRTGTHPVMWPNEEARKGTRFHSTSRNRSSPSRSLSRGLGQAPFRTVAVAGGGDPGLVSGTFGEAIGAAIGGLTPPRIQSEAVGAGIGGLTSPRIQNVARLLSEHRPQETRSFPLCDI